MAREHWFTTRPWRGRFFEWSVASGAVITALFFVIVFGPQLGWVSRSVQLDRVNLFFQTVVFVWACVAIGSAIARSHGRVRLGWSLFTASMVLMAVGMLWFFAEALEAQTVTYFSTLGIALYVVCVPMAAAGIILLNPGALRLGPTTRILLDGLIIAASLFFLQWAIALGPIFEAAEGPLVQRVAMVAFPMFDWVLVTVLITLGSRTAAVQRGPFPYLFSSVLIYAITDTGSTYYALTSGYQPGLWVDFGYTVGTILLGVSALRPMALARAGKEEDMRASLWGMLLPFAPVTLGAFAAIWTLVTVGSLGLVLEATGIGVILLVVARQALTMVENHRMAQRLDRTANYKSELLRFVSHEIANPVTPLKLQLSALRAADPDRRRQIEARAFEVIERNVDRLFRISTEVLDLSRLEAGRLALDSKPVDLLVVVESAVAAYTPVAHQRHVSLLVDASKVPAIVDADRVGQILDNLLSNAVKFTPAGGRVVVRLSQNSSGIHVSVEDTGVGMSRAQLQQLFTPFGRVHAGESKVPGNGLGLYFSRGIAQAHGGELWAESAGPGQGARFVLRLAPPTSGPPMAQAPAVVGAESSA